MELDDLKKALAELDRRMDADRALAVRTRTDLLLDRSRPALNGLARVLWLEIAIAVVAVLWLGAFLAVHLDTLRFAVSAAVLQVSAVVLAAVSVRQLVAVRRIDFGAPVVRIQREVAALRRLRARVSRWVLLTAPLLWTPVAVVLLEGAFGFDLVQAFGAAWVVANVGLGVVVIALGLWLAHRYGDRLHRHPRLRRLSDDLAGRRLAEAMRFMDEAAAYERE